MSLKNKDFAHATWIDDEPNESIIIRLAIAVLLMIAIATIYAVSAAPDVGPMVYTAYDHLNSDEVAAYAALHGCGEEYREYK